MIDSERLSVTCVMAIDMLRRERARFVVATARATAVRHGEWRYRDIPGFCKAAQLADIEKHGFVLTPGRYVGAEEQEDDGEPFAEKFPRLVGELEECFAESERMTHAIRANLRRINDGA